MSGSLTCMALATVLAPEAPGDGPLFPETPACLAARVEGAGRWGLQGPDILQSPYLSLSRARAALGVGQGVLGARVAVVGVRSAPEQGYVGIDGEAWVPALQLAEGRFRLDRIGLAGAMGLVDDIWVATGNAAWGLRAVAPVLGEAQGWMTRSDLGALGAWTSPGRWVTLSASLTTGEGANRRDRNDGFDTTGVLAIHPLAAIEDAPALELQLMLRDGSWGQSYVRDHRQGIRARFATGMVVVGAELLAAQGVQGDGARAPTGWSAWASAEPESLPLLALLRVDGVSEDAGNPDARSRAIWAGGGLRLPAGRSQRPAGRLSVVYHGESRGDDAAPLAGASNLSRLHQVFVQLDVDVLTTLWSSGPAEGGEP